MEQNEKKFKELIHRNSDLIWSICKSYRLSAAWTTDDAFHEVLCNLWRGFESFDNRSSERTWVFRVATNTMISLTRKIENQPTTQAKKYQEPSYNDEGFYDLVEMIEAITEPDRTIIKSYARGFSYAEIAKATGLTLAAVSMRLSRALRKLRKQFNRK